MRYSRTPSVHYKGIQSSLFEEYQECLDMKLTGDTDQTFYVTVKGPNYVVILMGLDIDSNSGWRV
jgi:hypothetical protein